MYENDVFDRELKELGWKRVGGIMLGSEPWQYYDADVYEDPKGGFFLGTDSGCSCPTPFENHTAADFTGPLTKDQVIEEIISLSDEDVGNTEVTIRAEFGW